MEKVGRDCNFLIYDFDRKDIRDFQREISLRIKSEVQHAETLIEAVNVLKKGELFCVILNVSDLNEKNMAAVTRLRLINQDNFIFIVSDIVNKEMLALSKQCKRLFILQKPLTEAKMVALFCEKIIQGGEIFQREHPRFETKEPALLEKINGIENSRGVVLNISKGGAYVELDKKIPIRRLEIIKLTLNLGNTAKERVVFAEVAWTESPNLPKERLGVGLRFVSSKK